MAKSAVAYNDVPGEMAGFTSVRQPMSRDSHTSSKRSKKIGVWSKMGSNCQIRQDQEEVGSQWCVINDSIKGGVNEMMGGVLNPCLIGRTRLP